MWEGMGIDLMGCLFIYYSANTEHHEESVWERVVRIKRGPRENHVKFGKIGDSFRCWRLVIAAKCKTSKVIPFWCSNLGDVISLCEPKFAILYLFSVNWNSAFPNTIPQFSFCFRMLELRLLKPFWIGNIWVPACAWILPIFCTSLV
jgi:hypothetical protein